MKLQELRKEYDWVVSLGVMCQVAYQLRRKGLRSASGPLDWVTSESLSQVTRLIRGRFAGFMEPENLKVEGSNDHSLLVRDTSFDMLSVHDFPLEHNRATDLRGYPEFKAKIDRRVARLLAQMDDPACSILFVRQFGRAANRDCWNWVVHEFQELIGALRECVRGPFEVLAATDTPLDEFVQGDWAVEQAALAQMPPSPPERWQGCDAEWDVLLAGIRLKL